MTQRPVGPYLVESRLAAGGMAEVFIAKRVGPHGFSKRVALKRILPQYARDPDFVAMFIAEARLAAQLDHPNIVQVFDFGELEGGLFLAMELVTGTTVNRLLRTVAARGENVPPDVALEIAWETARALAYAHALKGDEGQPLSLVHRDVSPANILLTRTGNVKLSDFGIARASSVDRRTDQGRLRGKLGYMSPEQVMGKPLDGRSDVFTLVTVLAEMLLAEPLFGTGTDIDILLRIRDVDLRVLQRTEQRIPNEVRRLLTLGLERDPANRPDSVELAEAIGTLVRKRGKDAGPERVARLLARLELVEPMRPEDALGTELPTTLLPLEAPGAGAVSVESETAAQGVRATTPAIWRVRLADGRLLGPVSFPKLVELITTGVIGLDTEIAKGDAAFQPPGAFPELTRFVTSPALQWNEHETDAPTWKGPNTPGALLPIVFQLVTRRETGVLHLHEAERRKKIYFVEGRPEFVASTDRRELLGEFLVQEGLVLRMEMEMALALLPRYGGRLGDALVGLGVLRPVELFRAISAQVTARYLEAFRWSRGEWLYVRDARSHEETFPLGKDPYELLREAVVAMHIDAVQAALTPLGERVLVRAPAPLVPLSAYRVPKTWLRVLGAVRGDVTLPGLVVREAASGDSDPEDVYRAIYLGVSCGLILAR